MRRISIIAKQESCTKEELSRMIDGYERLVFSICYKLTGDYFASEDLTQETFLSAYQKYNAFDGTNEKAWICRIAANKSIDYLRSAVRRNVPTEDVFFENRVEMRGSPEEICLEDEVREKLNLSIRGLKPPYDQVAKAYYLEELTPAEIAKRRGVNVKTIHTQIYRAREMLKKIYGKEEPE